MEKTESLPKETTEKVTMTDSSPKEIFKKVIKKIFTYEFEDLKQTENYNELLNIAKKVDGLNLNKWLILKALEVMVIDNGKLKNKLENDDAIKYFEYIFEKNLMKMILNSKKNLNYLLIIKNIHKFLKNLILVLKKK